MNIPLQTLHYSPSGEIAQKEDVHVHPTLIRAVHFKYYIWIKRVAYAAIFHKRTNCIIANNNKCVRFSIRIINEGFHVLIK